MRGGCQIAQQFDDLQGSALRTNRQRQYGTCLFDWTRVIGRVT